MSLKTSYLGLELKNPLIASSSRLTGEMKSIMQCADNGIGAIVLKSLFEEQIRLEAESKSRMGSASEYYYWNQFCLRFIEYPFHTIRNEKGGKN